MDNEGQVLSFTGQWSNRDEHDLEPGQASLQVNLLSRKQGELQIRGGLRQQQDDSE